MIRRAPKGMTKRELVIATSLLGAIGFAGAAYHHKLSTKHQRPPLTSQPADLLVRPHSPVIGRADAPVTIVEFFDPSCETCRAFHPIVKQIVARHPDDVRLILRYAPFHKGSDEAVAILETARLQNAFLSVLDALLATQPNWAVHGAPNLNVAWEAARTAGLDIERARRDAHRPEIIAVLQQDAADIRTVGVKQTPTFFVNGKPLPSFGSQQLYNLVRAEIDAARGDPG